MRIISIQLLRGIAAWVVVFHHVGQTFFTTVPDTFFGWLLATKGSAGVELFFVISGFVMVISTDGKGLTGTEFFLRRLARIVPVYWLYTALMSIAVFAIPSLEVWPVQLNATHILLSFGFLSGFVPGHFYPVLTVGWSLNYEMVFYVLFAISLARFSSLVPSATPWVLPVLLLALQLYPSDLPGGEMLAGKLMLVFLAGYALGLLHVRNRLASPAWLGWPLIGVGLCALMLAEGRSSFGWVVASTFVVWGALCFERRIRTEPWVAQIGDWSYATYLVHVLVLMLAKHFYDNHPTGALPVWIAASLATIAILSWLTYVFVEAPATRSLQRLLGSRRPHATITQASSQEVPR